MGNGLNQAMTAVLCLAWVIIYYSMMNGSEQAGAKLYFVAMCPYVILTIFLGMGLRTGFPRLFNRLTLQSSWLQQNLYPVKVEMAAKKVSTFYLNQIGSCWQQLVLGLMLLVRFSIHLVFHMVALLLFPATILLIKTFIAMRSLLPFSTVERRFSQHVWSLHYLDSKQKQHIMHVLNYKLILCPMQITGLKILLPKE